MRGSVLMSVGLHVAVVTLVTLGLPHLRRAPPEPEVPVVIDTVELGAITNMPTARQRPKKEEKPKAPPKEEAKPAPPPPPPKVKPAPPPPEEEVAAKEPEPVPAPPEAKPEPKEAPKPKPKKVEAKPEPKEPPKPVAPTALAHAKPKKKPKPPDPFAGVLKTVEKLNRTPPPETDDKAKATKKAEKTDFQQQIAVALARRPTEFNPERKITISERDALIAAIKSQIEPCWNLPAGAKDVGDMVIEIKMTVSQDGRVRNASIQDATRMFTDPFFRAAAESALRAVKNPRCSPLKLPADQYDVWKDLTLSFNPKDLVGG